MKIILTACKGPVDYSYKLANAICDKWRDKGLPALTYLIPLSMHATQKSLAFDSLCRFLKTEPLKEADILVCIPSCDEVTANKLGLNIADGKCCSEDVAFVAIEENKLAKLHGYNADGCIYGGVVAPHWSGEIVECACESVGLEYNGSSVYTIGWFIPDPDDDEE